MSLLTKHCLIRGLTFALILGISANPSFLSAASEIRPEPIKTLSRPSSKASQVNEKISEVENKSRDTSVNDTTLQTQLIENTEQHRTRPVLRKRPVSLSRLFAALIGADQQKK
jgi:hypothetical protein